MTHTLFIDEGNSRIKYWMSAGDDLTAQGHLQDILDLSSLRVNIDLIVVATVKSTAELQRQLISLYGHAMPIVWVSVQPAILPTAYRDPTKLGIDRWLAVLAAKYLGSEVAIVVDAGTAITIDVLDSLKGHAGGYILPGLSMQQASLAAHTARVRFPSPDWCDESLGVDTASAVGHGSVRAVCALVREMQSGGVSGQCPDVFLTGGNATDLAAFLPEARIEPNLVQIGLKAFQYYASDAP